VFHLIKIKKTKILIKKAPLHNKNIGLFLYSENDVHWPKAI